MDLTALLAQLDYQMLAKGALLFIVGLIVASVMARMIGRAVAGKLSQHHKLVVQKVAYYALLLIFTLTAMGQLGFETDALVALAGILTVAVGFASQNASSNVISGLFLIGERPFKVGDRIRFDKFEGEVIAIDLLSVKLRLYDNTMYRIPNELLLRTPVINLTKFGIRRLDCQFTFDAGQDMQNVENTALASALKMDILVEPKPRFTIKRYEPHGLSCQLSIWLPTENFYELKTQCYQQLLQDLNAVGIKYSVAAAVATS